ncbi:MAG: glycosyltransferase, partial [Desulfobulbaceae bacterium]|nr:glycosyltransferase [Desulfobulbaceae bacterium]
NDFPQVNLIANTENRGFGAANNQAYNIAKGDYFILLNPDTIIKPSAIDNSIRFMQSHPKCGLCGGRLIKPDGELDPSARRFPNSWFKLLTLSGLSDCFSSSSFFNSYNFGGFDHQSAIEVDWVPGTYTVYRRALLQQVGMFDERFYLYYEETDLCLRAKRVGWKIFFIPDAEVVHVGGASSKTRKDLQFDAAGSQVLKFRLRSELLYFRKNYGLVSLLANAGVEMGWHLLRYLVNLLPRRDQNKDKRTYSFALVKQIICAVKDTHWGTVSPPIPW